jgi:hypothetical protein
MDANGMPFTFNDLRQASGWSYETAHANVGKKLKRYLASVGGGYTAMGMRDVTEEAFCRICSQSSALSDDPHRPLLTPPAEGLVIKAREAAMAAVQHYNNPTAIFRSGNYITLMMIAYTALFHAIFERDAVSYIEVHNDGTAKSVGGLPMLWDCVHSSKFYAENHSTCHDRKAARAMAKNLEFFAPIRNHIEHRFMPQLDEAIVAECQSMLMNFETILSEEFTFYYSLNQSLALALQFSTHRTPASVDALRRVQSQEYDNLRTYINNFRAGLPDDIFGDPAFAFRVMLIPKPVSEARKSDVSIEFVKIDPNNPQQTAELERLYVCDQAGRIRHRRPVNCV